MVYQLYNGILLLAAFFLVPYYLLRGIKYGKSRRGIRERLACYESALLEDLQKKPVIWIHAVSVGETRAAAPLIRQIRQDYPDHLILVSNVTETGHAIARDNPDIDKYIFFPFDFSWVVRRALSLVKPVLVIIVETEIWPNFIRQARTLDIPLILANGRISDRSYPRYRFCRFLLQPVLNSFSAFCMQTQVDAERVIALGADSSRVENSGNLKFDHELIAIDSESIKEKKQRYGLPDNAAIMVAGSTHEGEERQLVDAFRAILPQLNQDLVLVLIPRHPERKHEVVKLLKDAGLRIFLRSTLEHKQERLVSGEVLLVDTLGEVLDFYAVAELVFVGGSLVPVGGHNMLEASLLAKPVVFGPHIHNFKEISRKLIRSGAGIMVRDRNELEKWTITILNDPIRCRAMGAAGRSLIVENAGATERTMGHIRGYVKH